VGIRSISVGAVISPTTVVTKLQQINPLRIDFMLPDRYRDKIVNGKEVFFSVSGSLDTLSGNIKAIEPGADVNTRNIRVQATIPNKNNKLISGAFAHVIIPFSSNNNALLIPAQSVIPTTKEKKAAILRNGKAEIVTIVLGTRTTDKVEILSGLQAGDTVLTTGIMQVKQGMEVKVSKLKQ
jgi:membrane fusion protein (multidrug efflux system)